MGLKKMAEIAAIHAETGWAPTPAAVVPHASTFRRKVTIGRMQDPLALIAAQEIIYPVIVLTGNVVCGPRVAQPTARTLSFASFAPSW